jgi:hypothetical protein
VAQVINIYAAFLNRGVIGKRPDEQLTTTVNALMCGETVLAEWRGEGEIVLPRIENPTKRMTTHRNGISELARSRGIRVVEER